MPTVRVRFAPSPTGKFHVGLARTALFNFLFARNQGGRFLLRIEDTDPERSKPVYEQEIRDALAWLGMVWDEEPLRQSERISEYGEKAVKLIHEGKAFRCFCRQDDSRESRKQPPGQSSQPGCLGGCHTLSEDLIGKRIAGGERHVVRFRTPPGVTAFEDMVFGAIRVENEELGDFIILRSDGTPVYHLAVVLDDIHMDITHIIRGVDHLKNTAKHVLLFRSFGVDPPRFAHLPMILGPDKQKLSKRHSLVQVGHGHRVLHLVEEYREAGYLAQGLINFLALLGWAPPGDDEIFYLDGLIREFSLERVSKKDAVFDPEKLTWLNGQYIRSLPVSVFVEEGIRYLEKAGIVGHGDEKKRQYAKKILPMIQDRTRIMSDVPDLLSYFFEEHPVMEEKAVRKHLTRPDTADKIRRLRAAWSGLPEFTEQATEDALRALAAEYEISAGKLIHPARVAMTGRTAGPGLFEIAVALGRDRVLERLDRAAKLAATGGESSNGRTCGSGP